MGLGKDENGQKRDSSDQLYLNERLTPGASGLSQSAGTEKERSHP